MKKIVCITLIVMSLIFSTDIYAQFMPAISVKVEEEPASAPAMTLSTNAIESYSIKIIDSLLSDLIPNTESKLIQLLSTYEKQHIIDSLRLKLCQEMKTNKTASEMDKISSLDLGGYLSTNLDGFSVSPKIFAKSDFPIANWATVRARVFGVEASKDSSFEANGSQIFIPESAIVGINYQNTANLNSILGNTEKPIFSAVLDLFYSLKQLTALDSSDKSGTTGIIQSKVGLNIMFIPNVFSIYGNYNVAASVVGVSDYKQVFGEEVSTRSYFFDAGIAAKFDNFILDVNFIFMNKNLRLLTGYQDDILKPVIRLGFEQPIIYSQN